eukprot:gene23497-biopygen14877
MQRVAGVARHRHPRVRDGAVERRAAVVVAKVVTGAVHNNGRRQQRPCGLCYDCKQVADVPTKSCNCIRAPPVGLRGQPAPVPCGHQLGEALVNAHGSSKNNLVYPFGGTNRRLQTAARGCENSPMASDRSTSPKAEAAGPHWRASLIVSPPVQRPQAPIGERHYPPHQCFFRLLTVPAHDALHRHIQCVCAKYPPEHTIFRRRATQ